MQPAVTAGESASRDRAHTHQSYEEMRRVGAGGREEEEEEGSFADDPGIRCCKRALLTAKET